MKTNPLMEECRKLITPEIEERVERTCKMMDDCEEILNNEYADVEIHKPLFYEGFKAGINYVRDNNAFPIYIITQNTMYSSKMLFVSTNKEEAEKFYSQLERISYKVIYAMYGCNGVSIKLIKSDYED